MLLINHQSIKTNKTFRYEKIIFPGNCCRHIITSCEKDNDNDNDKGGIFKGPETELYHGKAWTWIQLDKAGKPQKVAISLSENVLQNVEGSGNPGGPHHDHENNVVLKFHPKADVTPYKHVWLNWNPDGDPPVGIYNKPHFDLHYYMVSAEERETFVDPANWMRTFLKGIFPPITQVATRYQLWANLVLMLLPPNFKGSPFHKLLFSVPMLANLHSWSQ